MFTGIVHAIGKIASIKQNSGHITFAVTTHNPFFADIQKGASVAINGVCLTVTSFDNKIAYFDAIEETLQRTTLQTLTFGQEVNLERAARIGDEIGGHLISGHIVDTIQVQSISKSSLISFICPKQWMKYLFPKGYVALNGASLTLVDVNTIDNTFSVHLIPETLQQTTFGSLKVGDLVNLEIDAQTQAIVDTLERIYEKKRGPENIS